MLDAYAYGTYVEAADATLKYEVLSEYNEPFKDFTNPEATFAMVVDPNASILNAERFELDAKFTIVLFPAAPYTSNAARGEVVPTPS